MTTITSTTKEADKVLREVKKLIKPLKLKYVYSEPYQNGREHGIALLSLGGNRNQQVCFSEYRNTDNIVVYFGTVADFQMAGNVPSDKVYSNKKFFSYGEYTEAAKFIVEYLK